VKISKDGSPKRASIHTQSSDNTKLVFLTSSISSLDQIGLESAGAASAMNANMIEHNILFMSYTQKVRKAIKGSSTGAFPVRDVISL
jgi:hypothetical protein